MYKRQPEDILIDAKPHVGTDYLHIALKELRRRLLDLGTDIRFESRLTGLEIQNGALAGIRVAGNGGETSLPCRQLILCPGHSARDTFETVSYTHLGMFPIVSDASSGPHGNSPSETTTPSAMASE